MGRMADAEVRNAENTYDCWNNFQKTIMSFNIKYWTKRRPILSMWEDHLPNKAHKDNMGSHLGKNVKIGNLVSFKTTAKVV